MIYIYISHPLPSPLETSCFLFVDFQLRRCFRWSEHRFLRKFVSYQKGRPYVFERWIWYLGKIPILTHMFKMGWFNQQPVTDSTFFVKFVWKAKLNNSVMSLMMAGLQLVKVPWFGWMKRQFWGKLWISVKKGEIPKLRYLCLWHRDGIWLVELDRIEYVITLSKLISLLWMFPKIGGFYPKMDGEHNGKPYFLMDDLGVPLFSETSINIFF